MSDIQMSCSHWWTGLAILLWKSNTLIFLTQNFIVNGMPLSFHKNFTQKILSTRDKCHWFLVCTTSICFMNFTKEESIGHNNVKFSAFLDDSDSLLSVSMTLHSMVFLFHSCHSLPSWQRSQSCQWHDLNVHFCLLFSERSNLQSFMFFTLGF